MKKKRGIRRTSIEHPIRWLPIDSRLFSPIFQFGQVQGIARIFLEIEITLAIIIVVGTFIVAGIKVTEMIMR